MRSRRCEVVVAGLGAMGSAIAFHLARQGSSIVGIDTLVPPHDQGSSHGESRIIREAYFEHSSYVPLVRRAHLLWRELASLSGRDLLRTTGALMLGAEGCELIEGSTRSAREHELEHERLEVDELRRRYPTLRPMEETVGLYEPRAGVLHPELCVRAHIEAARQHGADLRFGESLTSWHTTGTGLDVTTDRSRYHADALVLALGAWLPQVIPSLPLEVERQVVFWFEPAGNPAEFVSDRFPVFLWEVEPDCFFYGIPDLGRGVKVARHHGGEKGPMSEIDRTVRETDALPVRRFLEHFMPAANGPLLRASVCMYTNTRDGHFLIDRHPDDSRVWLVSPCSGHGFKFASAIGEAVAQSVAAGRLEQDLAWFGRTRLQG